MISLPLIAADNKYIKTYRGSGDDYILIEKQIDDLPAAATIFGNIAERHFSVKSYSATGEYIDLLVNTTDYYQGTVPFDLGSNKTVRFLDIKAIGNWTVIVYPLIAIPHLTKKVSDTGDSLLWINGAGSMLSIIGNSSERHFSVKSFDSYGNYNDLLVNTTNRYSGKLRLPKDSLILQISAVGDWSIELL